MRKMLLVAAAVLAGLASTFVVTASAEAAASARWSAGSTVTPSSRPMVRFDSSASTPPSAGDAGTWPRHGYANGIAPKGSIIRLGNPTSVMDHDRYGRLLRYVNRGARDLSAAQISHGARARYDSRDGYQWHPRQARYRRLDATHRNYRCAATPSAGVSGAVAPSGRSCPAYAPIKGNARSMIYHRPGQQYYNVTNPEACFRNAASAAAAGYRAAKI